MPAPRAKGISTNFEYDKTSLCCGYLMQYRYGFQGQEKDDELKGAGNSYDFGARLFDSRLGRWLSLDPLVKEYPSLSAYSFSAGSPILYVDRGGEKIFIHYIDENGNNQAYEYGSKQTAPNNHFVQEAINALNEISESPKVGHKLAELVSTEDNNFNIHNSLITKTSVSITSAGEITLMGKEQHIYFNPNLALENAEGEINAPFINLWHELGHQYNAFKKVKDFITRLKDKSEKEVWSDGEEKYNIKENEHPLVEDKGGFKRETHKEGGEVKIVEVESSTSKTKKE